MDSLEITSEGRYVLNLDHLLRKLVVKLNKEGLSTALLILNNHWSNKTMDGEIGAVIINDQKVHSIPASVQDYNNTLDLIPFLTGANNIMTIVFMTFDLGPWKNFGSSALIIDGHNVESLTYSSGGDNEKDFVTTRNIQR